MTNKIGSIWDGINRLISAFNCAKNLEISSIKFWFEPLNAKQIISEVENYKSADDMYVFGGTFMCREYIENWVKDNKRVLNAKFQYIEV